MQGLLTCGHILVSWCDPPQSFFSSLKRIAGTEREGSFYPFVPLSHCPSQSLWVNQFPSQTCGTNFATAQTPLVTFLEGPPALPDSKAVERHDKTSSSQLHHSNHRSRFAMDLCASVFALLFHFCPALLSFFFCLKGGDQSDRDLACFGRRQGDKRRGKQEGGK